MSAVRLTDLFGRTPKKRRGLTMIELMISMVVTFCCTSVVAGFLVTSYNAFEHSRERTESVFLAWHTIDDWLLNGAAGGDLGCSPPDGYNNNNGADPDWGTEDPIYSGQVHLLNIQTNGFMNANVNVLSCVRWVPLSACGAGTVAAGQSGVLYTDVSNSYPFLNTYNEATGSHQRYPMMPIRDRPTRQHPYPPNGTPGGLFMKSDCSLAWIADTTYGGFYVENNPLQSQSWTSWQSRGACCAIDGLSDGSVQYATHSDSHAIEYAHNGTWTGSNDMIPLPPSPLLVDPNALAFDAPLNQVWVGDKSTLCLRKFDPTSATFDPTMYKPAFGAVHLGMPRGIAWVPSANNDALCVIDALNLWQFTITTNTWTPTPLPPDLQGRAAGMCSNKQSGDLFIPTTQGKLWKCSAPYGSGNFVEKI